MWQRDAPDKWPSSQSIQQHVISMPVDTFEKAFAPIGGKKKKKRKYGVSKPSRLRGARPATRFRF